VSIAAGTALISHLSYRVLLLAVVGVVEACAVVILTGRPRAGRGSRAEPAQKRFRGNARPG
jgi:hypothetical protein